MIKAQGTQISAISLAVMQKHPKYGTLLPVGLTPELLMRCFS